MSELACVKLRPDHDLAAFDCGEPDLDEWLRSTAEQAGSAGSARTYVWTELDSPVVTAYFSICPTTVVRDDVTSSVGRGLLREAPGFLLARLALDQSLRRQRLGGVLLREALSTMVAAVDLVGGSLLVVDALHEKAAEFYERHDFKRDDERLRLAMRVSTARKILNQT